MTGRLSDEELTRYFRSVAKDSPMGRVLAEVRERRAAEQRVRDVLAEWDETEPEDGWGRMAEEIAAALGS